MLDRPSHGKWPWRRAGGLPIPDQRVCGCLQGSPDLAESKQIVLRT